ncbi:ATP-binding protein, partial [Rhizobium rhizoryzae]
AMSTGTRYQLYLALRLAGYEEFAAVRPSIPFVADDIMETFDEPRSEEVFRLFGQMATMGQVIYLTHHRHLCDIARSVVPDVQIHEL